MTLNRPDFRGASYSWEAGPPITSIAGPASPLMYWIGEMPKVRRKAAEMALGLS